MSNVRVRELSGIRAVPLSAPAAADLALISREFARAQVTEEDVHVREARVAHNQHDRTGERFTGVCREPRSIALMCRGPRDRVHSSQQFSGSMSS